MDFSNLKRFELYGLAAAALLLISLFLPWFDLTHSATRPEQQAWVCGKGDYQCTAWETFPINRWLFVAAAAAPLLLAYFIVTGQRGQYPTGEFTMTVGLAVIVLVGFNGLIQKPQGDSDITFGVSLSYGYFLALLAGLGLTVAGALRSLESGGGAQRKPPATF